MNKKSFSVSILVLMAALVTFVFRTPTAHAEETTYKIGTDLTFAPFEFQDASGKYVGIDIDLINAIAKSEGFKVDIQPVGFDAAVQGVTSSQFDGMISGMSITEERKAKFDFSDPYYDSGIQMAVKSDNKSIKGYEDLKGKTVAAKVGTESATYLEKNKDKYGYKIKLYDAADTMYNTLTNGNVVAIFDDYPVLGYAISKGQPLKLVGDEIKGASYGFAVKKGENSELLASFNEGLAKLKANGQYDKIVDKYISDGKTQETDTVDESTISGLLKNNGSALLSGFGKTVALALISFALAAVVGVIFGLFSVAPNRALRIISGVYVDIIRGIPMMVLAFFIYFGLPGITGIKLSDFLAGIITLTLNASAYIAEIVRGGIQAVPEGQMEASRSLGLSYAKTMRKIVLPQAVRIMIPSFVNQFVISLKDTTIISAIGVVELLQTGKIIVARTAQSSLVYLIIAVMYLVLITILTKLAKRMEKRVRK